MNKVNRPSTILTNLLRHLLFIFKLKLNWVYFKRQIFVSRSNLWKLKNIITDMPFFFFHTNIVIYVHLRMLVTTVVNSSYTTVSILLRHSILSLPREDVIRTNVCRLLHLAGWRVLLSRITLTTTLCVMVHNPHASRGIGNDFHFIGHYHNHYCEETSVDPFDAVLGNILPLRKHR